MLKASDPERELLEKLRSISRSKILLYEPYPKQSEFHDAGVDHRERLLMASNQSGKTLAGAAEAAIHLTGRYPEWWKGRRFDHPIRMWAAGVTNEGTRDNPQRMLLGSTGEYGTGMIPADDIAKYNIGRGLPNAVDTCQIRHASGGLSYLSFTSYEKGRSKWQGETLDVLWLDEEPPPDIYSEGLTRTNAGDNGRGGIAFVTFTPLMGMTEVVTHFYPQVDSPARHLTHMTLEDVGHYTEEYKVEIAAAYPQHEREARARGIPMLGSGRVFPIEEEAIVVEPFPVPDHFAQVIGIDFGWDHPFAAVRLAWDRDNDVVYATDGYRRREATPPIHASALKKWGDLPVAWPHDGHQHDRGSGEPLSMLYRKEGLRMLPEHATFESGGYSLEAGVLDMLTRMQTGRFKVFSSQSQWLAEFRLYHRKEGKIVKKGDDLMSATRQGVMALRFSRAGSRVIVPQFIESYDPLASMVMQ